MTFEQPVAPRARVTITYAPPGPSAPGSEVELPLRILMVGDYTQRPDPRALDERRPVAVDTDSFARVLADHALTLDLTVPDRLSPHAGSHTRVSLSFKRLQDFAPEGVARQVPAMRELLELRVALSAIKGPLGPVPSFTKRIKSVLNSKECRQRLRREMGLDGVAAPPPEAGEALVGELLLEAHIAPEAEGYDVARRGLEAVLAAAMTPKYEEMRVSKSLVDEMIAELDARLSAQVNEVLHHPAFQRLEAAWRTLRFVVDRVDFRENIALEVLHCSKDDLLLDFEDSPDLPRSGLYKVVYGAVFGVFDAAPYGLIVADHEFGPSPRDLWLLRRCGAVAAAAHAPFLAAASPAMIGASSWSALPEGCDLGAVFDGPGHASWRAFRASDEARYVGLCLPRFALRLPYGNATIPVKAFNFEEDVDGRDERYLWGSAAAALATRAADSFAKYRWCANIVGAEDGRVDGLPLHRYEVADEIQSRASTERSLSARCERALSEAGFIGLSYRDDIASEAPSQNAASACFFSARCCFDGEAQLPYLFVVARFAHYVKALHRACYVVTGPDPADLQRVLHAWLQQYVAPVDPSPGLYARRPLFGASIAVEWNRELSGTYRFHLHVRPHFASAGAPLSLSLVGGLDV